MSVGDERTQKGPSAPQPNPAGSSRPSNADTARRRAEALRANLKRRKAQQRDRAEIGKTSSADEAGDRD